MMHPPGNPAMLMMVLFNPDEFDRNGDHALSREEFRAMQLRIFDALDGNGDRRIQLRRPPHMRGEGRGAPPPEQPAPPPHP